MHKFVPVVAKVDRATGQVEVSVGDQRINMDDPRNERMMIADLGKYVKGREAFTRGEAESHYQTVWYMSSADLRGEWEAAYMPSRNPKALLATLTAKDQIKVTNMSVQFLPSDRPDLKVAQVRYDKEKRIGTAQPTTQRFISTFTFTYDPANVPTAVEGIIINPFGFTALNYRSDKESEERVLATQDAGIVGRSQ
jgi:type IV secretion system protein VirB8